MDTNANTEGTAKKMGNIAGLIFQVLITLNGFSVDGFDNMWDPRKKRSVREEDAVGDARGDEEVEEAR